MEKLLAALVLVTMAQSINGWNLFSRRGLKENPEEMLTFAVRALDMGMDLDKQAEIDKKEMQMRGLKHCEHSKCPFNLTLPEEVKGCKAFAPKFNDAEDGSGCSCIVGYECCPDTCQDAVNHCKKGATYGVLRHDCCGCPTYMCNVCPAVNQTCNKCDEAVRFEEANGCPFYRCQRKSVEPKPTPKCSICERIRTRTDDCGNHEEYCECSMTPEMVKDQCTPQKPEKRDCYDRKQIHHPTYGCKSDNKTCQQCYHWSYEPEDQEIVEKVCKPCEMAKVEKTTCGFRTVCQCRQFDNCFPDPPEELACHKIEKVLSQDTFQCDEESENGCKACYTWKYVSTELSRNTTECDNRCTYKRPVSSECGSGEICQCNGKEKSYCQPEKPKEEAGDCYSPVKVLTQDSFMCDSAESQKCVQCWTWTYEKKPCLVQPPLTCSACETEKIVHTGCGCSEKHCVPIVLDNCQPPKLEPDQCYHEAEKVWTEVSYTPNGCIDCYYWNRTRKQQPQSQECTLKNLPNECYVSHHATGTCDQIVEKCTENVLACEETYGDGRRECAVGHKMVTLKSKCGKFRDACAECDKLVSSLPILNHPEECYSDHELSILGSCTQVIKLKKPCDFLDNIVPKICEGGMENKLFFDDCNCPKLKCFGCPSVKKVDVQLLLDSSGSMGTHWRGLINKIKTDFIGSVMSNKDSKMGIARFGETLVEITPLSSETSGKTLDSHTDFTNMGRTHTAGALRELLPSFQKAINASGESQAEKVLVVITDGDANGPGNVSEEAKKWVAAVDAIHVLGFGNLDVEGLKEINGGAPGVVLLKPNLQALEKAILEQIVPSICGQEKLDI